MTPPNMALPLPPITSRRWRHIHMLSGLLGVWVGFGVLRATNTLGLTIFPPSLCDDFQCGSFYPVLVLSWCCGGAVGSAVSYLITQRLARRPVDRSLLLWYFWLGTVGWIMFALAALVMVLVVDGLGVIDMLTNTQQERGVALFLVAALGVSLAGIVSGVINARLNVPS